MIMMISDAAPGPAAGPDPGPAARPRANVPVFRRRGGGGPVAAARPGGRLGAQLSARVLSRRVTSPSHRDGCRVGFAQPKGHDAICSGRVGA